LVQFCRSVADIDPLTLRPAFDLLAAVSFSRGCCYRLLQSKLGSRSSGLGLAE
jgi:hypothetical protein